MRNILLFTLLICALPAYALDRITGILSVTNAAGTTNGQTFVYNGATRTWTNTVTSSPSTLIQVTNSPSLVTTQLLTHLGQYDIGPVSVTYGSSTSLVFQATPGAALNLSASGWATIIYTTNPVSSGTPVRVPLTVETATNRITIASLTVKGLSDYSTNAFATNSTALTNHLSRGPQSQTVRGQVIFQNGVGGTNIGLTNGPIVGAAITSATFDGGSIGLTTDVELGKTVVDDNTADRIAFKGPSGVTNGVIKATDSGPALYDVLGSSTPLNVTAPDDLGVLLNLWSAIRLFPNLLSGLYIGTNVWNIQNDWFGTLNVFHDQLGASNFWATGWNTTNGVLHGTNINAGDISYPQYNVAVGNGVNYAVLVGTNEFVNAYGVTGAYEIDGFQGGRDGKEFTLLKTNSFTLTIGCDVGDPTLPNRIYTGSGASLSVTSNPALIKFKYINPLQRWSIIGRPPN